MEPASGRRRPTGRRPGDSGTRDAILAAALQLFAERGYDGTSMRAVAAQARVDPALVRHFYTDKDTLLSAALTGRAPIAERLTKDLRGDPETLGLRLADTYLGLWENQETKTILLAIAKSAMTSERAAAMLQQIFIATARNALPGVDDERLARVVLAISHLFGTAMARYVIKIEPVAAMTKDELVATVGPVIQRYL